MSMEQPRHPSAGYRVTSALPSKRSGYRSAATGRYYSEEARIAAARALVAADKKRGRATDPSIIAIAERGRAA